MAEGLAAMPTRMATTASASMSLTAEEAQETEMVEASALWERETASWMRTWEDEAVGAVESASSLPFLEEEEEEEEEEGSIKLRVTGSKRDAR